MGYLGDSLIVIAELKHLREELQSMYDAYRKEQANANELSLQVRCYYFNDVL
jgi:hypothetical protein